MRMTDCSSDVCSSDLDLLDAALRRTPDERRERPFMGNARELHLVVRAAVFWGRRARFAQRIRAALSDPSSPARLRSLPDPGGCSAARRVGTECVSAFCFCVLPHPLQNKRNLLI